MSLLSGNLSLFGVLNCHYIILLCIFAPAYVRYDLSRGAIPRPYRTNKDQKKIKKINTTNGI